jgi:hypothetical protein
VLSRTKDKSGAVTADSTKNILDLHSSTLQLLVTDVFIFILTRWWTKKYEVCRHNEIVCDK